VVAGVVTPTLHWPVSLPLREPPQAIFPLLSPLLSRHPAISKTPPTFHFHSCSASTFSTHHHNLRPRDQPLLLTARRHHRFTWQRPLYSTPSSSSFHEHITNEQLHDSESARHTLNPTGPRERARGARRSQLSFCEEGPTPTPECRCHCRRRRQSTLQPSGFPPLDVQTRQTVHKMPGASVAVMPSSAASTPATRKASLAPERKYKCQFCNRAFSRSEHRSRHERSRMFDFPILSSSSSSSFRARQMQANPQSQIPRSARSSA
jgi:hypothetical protein